MPEHASGVSGRDGDRRGAERGGTPMWEIRKAYLEQKKKDFRNHFALVGVVLALFSALMAALECLDQEEAAASAAGGKKV